MNQTAFFLIYSDGKRVWCNSVVFFVLLNPQILGIVYWCGLTSRTAQELCLPLSIMFKKSLQTSVPDIWKQALVTPIYKKGNRSKVENYHPISLTSTIGKILESIIRDEIYQYLTANNLLVQNQHQHGFTSGKSCTTQLLHPMELLKCTH